MSVQKNCLQEISAFTASGFYLVASPWKSGFTSSIRFRPDTKIFVVPQRSTGSPKPEKSAVPIESDIKAISDELLVYEVSPRSSKINEIQRKCIGCQFFH